MLTSASDQAVETLEVVRDVVVFAPIDVVFESLLEQLGPLNEGHDRTPIPMKLARRSTREVHSASDNCQAANSEQAM